MNKNRRLGKGLADLLGQTENSTKTDPKEAASQPAKSNLPAAGFSSIAIDSIDESPYQPRQHFDPSELNALAASLQQHDLLQPIVVRLVGNRYQLISGERRLKAATKAGWNPWEHSHPMCLDPEELLRDIFWLY